MGKGIFSQAGIGRSQTPVTFIGQRQHTSKCWIWGA